MRRLVILILIIQGLITTYVVIRDFSGLPSIPLLTIASTAIAFIFAWLHAGLNLGWRRALLFIIITISVALTLESIGVATGLIYGPYSYTDHLGTKFLDLVPYAIPLAWTMMLYPSYIIATRVTPTNRPTWRWGLGMVVSGAFIMTSWDLVMDPIMVAADHWIWEIEGAYFGIPLQNYLGWWLTALVILVLFVIIAKIKPGDAAGQESNNFNRLAILSYAILAISTILLAFNNDLGGPALAGLFAMAPWLLVGWWGANT